MLCVFRHEEGSGFSVCRGMSKCLDILYVAVCVLHPSIKGRPSSCLVFLVHTTTCCYRLVILSNSQHRHSHKGVAAQRGLVGAGRRDSDVASCLVTSRLVSPRLVAQ